MIMITIIINNNDMIRSAMMLITQKMYTIMYYQGRTDNFCIIYQKEILTKNLMANHT